VSHFGLAQGGTLDGKELHSRDPKGVVVCDRIKGQAELYRWDGTQFVHAWTRPLDQEKMESIPEDPYYDVIAHPYAGEY
jgi:hypothetical protein